MKFLVAYNGSNASERALEMAKKRARRFGAKVIIATSLVGGDDTPLEDVETARQGLDHAQSILDEEGLPCETHLLIRGLTAGEDLVQFADEIGADEVILGIRRKSKVGKLLFGSTAQYVILHAPCPVVSIR